MDDTEQDSLHADSTVLVATTIATLVLAGSAFICRSGRRLTLASALSRTDPDGSKHPLKAHAADNASDDAKDAKAARSKERRRRGKDPLKEILKGGKKLKALGIVPRDRDDIGSSTSASTSPLPRMTMMPESGSSQRSASLCTSSSRSVSASTASSALLHTTETDPAAPDSHDGDPATHGASEANSANNVSQIPETPIISISSTSPAATADKASAVQPSQTFPPYYPATGASGSWDWDGQRPSSTSDAVCRKPPRFRSKSKSRGAPVPPSVSMPFASTSASTSTSESTAHSPQQPSSLSSLSSEDLTFPTLNSAAPTAAPEASKPIVAAGGNGTPRRAPTPRRTPTPSSGSGGGNTPPPLSLAAQTQLASLRGALEAARMREEKARADLERCTKDVEMMRWENHTWRRRELELQGQIHHLMHQLQAYAALFASQMSPPPSASLQVPPGASPGGSSTHGPPSPSYLPPPPPPSQHSPGVHAQLLPGMFSPPPHAPPFFGYPAPLPPPPPPSLFALMFPGSGPPSSVSSASAGSVSPDLVEPLDRGRRRTRTQTAEARMGTWEGGEMGDGWVGVGVGVEEEREQEEDLEEGEDGAGYEDEGFSEVLADAILKRPESIRVRSKKGRERDRDRDQPPAEFTFPSISDFGNVSVNGAYRHVRSEPPAAAASPERAEAEAEAEAGENAAAP